MNKKRRKKQFDSIYEDDEHTSPGIEIHSNPKVPVLKPLQQKNERRGTPRYEVQFEAVIFCKGNSFRTQTINVSQTGVLLSENIPIDFVGQELDIVLTLNKGKQRYSFLMKGKGLDAPFRSSRIQFLKMEDTQIKKLDELFQKSKPYLG